MIFEFITDCASVSLHDLACMSYNLGLLYFLWDIFKYIRNVVKHKIGGL